MGEEEKEGWKSIKVKEGVYDDLKRMGVGIGKAVEILTKTQKEEIESKIEDIKGLGSDIATIMLEHGIFDIRFAGANIQDVIEDGDILQIKGFVNVVVPSEEARAQIIEALKGGEAEEEEGEEKEEEEQEGEE